MKRIFILLIIITVILNACQPTPEDTAVRSKDKDLVAEVIEANQEEYKEALDENKQIIEEQIQAINQHLNMEYQANDRVKIVVDADVTIPAFNKIPMVRVEPENVSQEQLEILIEEVAGDQPVYYQSTGVTSKWSQEEIQGILAKLKMYSQNDNLKPEVKERLENSLNIFDEEYPLSISKEEEMLYNGTLTLLDNNKSYSSVTSLKTYLGKTKAATFELSQSFNYTKSSLRFDNQEYGEAYTSFEPYEGVDAERIELSYEDCKLMAESLIKKLDGMDTDLSIVGSRIGYSIDAFAGYTKETSPQCYTFTFARVYNGVYAYPINYLRKQDHVNYSQVVETERLNLIIDNSGICYFNWSNPTAYRNTVSQDVPLVDFSTITEVFQDYCGYKFSWVPTYDNIPDDTTVTININRVEFNLMMTLEKDDIGSYIMIPVWDFIGDIDYDQEVFTIEGKPYYGEQDVAILTINAIDGTVIDREQGY